MRAVRLHGVGDLRFEQVRDPQVLASDGVRIKVSAAGICGSDLHNFRTGQWISRLPTIPGHEFAGNVLEVGSAVTGFTPGDLIVADSRINCGACTACRADRPNVCARMGYLGEVCDGGFAEFVDLPAHRLLHVPATVPPHIAALTEPLGVALHVIRRLDPPKTAPILIAGGGPIGGLAAILLQHLGFGPLAILERNPDRAKLVCAISGATVIGAAASEVRAFTGSMGLHYAIEATGSKEMLGFIIDSLRGGGRLAMVGLFEGQAAINCNAIVERELELRGCSVFCEEQREIIPMLPALTTQLEAVLSPAISLEEVPAQYVLLLAGKSAFLKTIVKP
jgi:(R,R)-butanediol dehydrogenase / meso-butanediol dehydrogenase / diacetyl reductase